MNYFENLTDEHLAQLYHDREAAVISKMMEQSEFLQDALAFYRVKEPTMPMLMFENELLKAIAERWMNSQPN